VSKKIRSPKDLAAMREQAKRDLEVRSGPKETQIVVHMGTCGIAAGAREVLSEIVDELSKAPDAEVSLRQTGCRGLCDREPMMTVKQASGQEFLYGSLDERKTREIVREHVLGGKPLMNYVIKTQK